VRLFVGVELEDSARARCAAAARDVAVRLRHARSSIPVRWIPEENLHITLAFLGEVSEERAAAVIDRLGGPWPVAAFSVDVAGVGAFPPSGPIRVFWLGIPSGADRLVRIYGELTARLAALGFETETRPYHPHITIGRAKAASSSASRKARAVLGAAEIHAGSSRVKSVTVFESRLSSAGARYEPLLRVPLNEC
jgi:2'-5' RNA ligase